MVEAESIRNTIRQSVNRITGIAPGEIQDVSDYRADLGLDSLSALEVVVDIEYALCAIGLLAEDHPDAAHRLAQRLATAE